MEYAVIHRTKRTRSNPLLVMAIVFAAVLGSALLSTRAFAFESALSEGPAVTDLESDPTCATVTDGSSDEESSAVESSDSDASSEVVLSAQGESGTIPVYRVLNPSTNEHLYTIDTNEVRTLVGSYGWTYEGAAWFAPSSGTPVYRLFQPTLGLHHYTADAYEIGVITGQQGWKLDFSGAAAFNSGGDITIYRLSNRISGQHLLTTDKNEYDVLPTKGWGWEQEPAETMRCAATGDLNYPYPGIGTCGSCSWDVTGGTLTIRPTSGTSGTLDNVGYDQSNYVTKASWGVYADSITKVVVASGVKTNSQASLFAGLHNVTSMDLSGLDTSSATDMSFMFADCASLTTLDVSMLKTSNVTNMAAMFAGCTTLPSLDLSALNTSKVSNMWIMFYKCSNLATLNLSGSFSTKAAAASDAINSMGNYFYGCHKISTVTLGPGFEAKGASSYIPAPVEPYVNDGTGRWVEQSTAASYMPVEISQNRTSTNTYVAQTVANAVPVYRVLNGDEHLYTTDANEVRTLVNSNGWTYEGTAWMAPKTGTPVYRLFQPTYGLHHYTSDAYEISVITGQQGWKLDFSGAAAFNSSGSITVYRLFDKNNGQHLLTTDKNEYDVLPTKGWGWVQEPTETMQCVAQGCSTYPMPTA